MDQFKEEQTKIIEEKGFESRNQSGAVKNDAKKARMSLIPQAAKMEVAKVMTYGAEKYAAYNWAEGFNFSILVDALERHTTAFMMGEDKDPESGYSHLAHAACCAMMLLEVTMLYPEKDDRWQGWKTLIGKQVREEAMSPFQPSEYLRNVLAKKKIT